jgi:membrane dipeptidase
MERLNIILDVTHLCDESFSEAMDLFGGAIWASHHNCRNLVPHNRQFTDEQIKLIIERNGVIGIPLDAWMMVPDWRRGVSTPESENVTLQIMVDNMDHICQLAGNANHVGIGSDLDGGFGKEQCPIDLDTIADLQKLTKLLKNRGYVEDDIDRILSQNAIDFLLQIWS